MFYSKMYTNSYLNSYSEEFRIPLQELQTFFGVFACVSQESLAIFVLKQFLTSIHLLYLQRQGSQNSLLNF